MKKRGILENLVILWVIFIKALNINQTNQILYILRKQTPLDYRAMHQVNNMIDVIDKFGKEKVWNVIETCFANPKVRLEYRGIYNKGLNIIDSSKNKNIKL